MPAVMADGTEVMLLAVARQNLPRLMQLVADLRLGAGVRIVDVVGMRPEDGGTRAVAIDLGGGGAPSATESRLASLVRVSLEPSAAGASAPSVARSALFGAGDDAMSLGDELVESARRLPDTHAAVLVVVSHLWRMDLAAMLAAGGGEVLLDGWLEGSE